MMGAWAQRNRGVDLARFVDDTTGLEIEPIAVDGVSGASLGSRPIRMSAATPSGDAADAPRHEAD